MQVNQGGRFGRQYPHDARLAGVQGPKEGAT